MKKLLSIFILFFISSHSFADENLPAVLISDMTTAWVGGSMYYRLEGGHVVEGCNPNDTRVVVQKSNSMYDEILSLSLAAHLARKKVVFRISGCITASNIMNAIAISIRD